MTNDIRSFNVNKCVYQDLQEPMCRFPRCEKIKAMPLLHTTPIQTLTALELLLDRAQMWEANACKAVSMYEPICGVRDRGIATN